MDKYILYCCQCQDDGPEFTLTPLGAAFGNTMAWNDFVPWHADQDHDIVIRKVES